MAGEALVWARSSFLAESFDVRRRARFSWADLRPVGCSSCFPLIFFGLNFLGYTEEGVLQHSGRRI